MSSFSEKLTDLYYIFDKYEKGTEPVHSDKFSNYLKDQPSFRDFAKLVFVLGFETRDLGMGQHDDDIQKLISMIEDIKKERLETLTTEEITKEDITILDIGLCNLYLYFCQSEEHVEPTKTDIILNAKDPVNNAIEPKVIITDIKQSVDYLRKAFILAHKASGCSGIYQYHINRLFDYMFTVFSNYKVTNDNKPIDVDSFYVFSDQIEEDSRLWGELEKQMTMKRNGTL